MAEEGLRSAAREGDIETVRKLLLVDTKQTANEVGETPLFLATTSYVTEPKYVEVVRELLENGADVNAANKAGDMPIHNTTSLGNFETTELLINYGADLETEGEAKMVPLGLAAMKKHHAIVSLLVNNLRGKNKITEKQFKWMHSATDDNQRLSIYRAITSILQDKKIIPELVKYGLIEAICKGLETSSKKGVVTHAVQLLIEALKNQEGLNAAKKKNVDKTVKETMTKFEGDAVLAHLGNQVIEQLK